MDNQNHVIAFDTIPDDIRGIYTIVGADSIRASVDGHWLIWFDSPVNAVSIEGAIRAAGHPAFAETYNIVTLRAITPNELSLFDDADQKILKPVIQAASYRYGCR